MWNCLTLVDFPVRLLLLVLSVEFSALNMASSLRRWGFKLEGLFLINGKQLWITCRAVVNTGSRFLWTCISSVKISNASGKEATIGIVGTWFDALHKILSEYRKISKCGVLLLHDWICVNIIGTAPSCTSLSQQSVESREEISNSPSNNLRGENGKKYEKKVYVIKFFDYTT